MKPLARLALVALVALAACSTRPDPIMPACTGAVFQLNPGMWTPEAGR